MGRDLYRKSELEALAAKYAQNVVTHRGFRPEDLPEIARNQEWKQASPGQREKVWPDHPGHGAGAAYQGRIQSGHCVPQHSITQEEV